MKKIIINADDYGLSKKFNQGTLELIEKGIVTSTTVMIGRDFVNPNDLLKFDDVSVGLHLELSEKTSRGEIVDQIIKFKEEFGKMPSHLDGHQHCHISDSNIETVVSVAQENELSVRSRFKEDRKILRDHGVRTCDEFVSWHPNRKEKFFDKLDNISELAEEVIEIVCHPGYFDENCSYPYNKRREEEFSILSSDGFLEKIKKYNLVNWHEF